LQSVARLLTAPEDICCECIWHTANPAAAAETVLILTMSKANLDSEKLNTVELHVPTYCFDCCKTIHLSVL